MKLRPITDDQKRAQHNWVALHNELVARFGIDAVLKWLFFEWVGWVDPRSEDKIPYLTVESALGEEIIYDDC